MEFIKSDPILAVFLVIGLAALVAAVLATWGHGLKKRLDELMRVGETSMQSLNTELEDLRRDVQRLSVDYATAQSRLQSEEAVHQAARETINSLTNERNTLGQNLSESEKQNAILQTELKKNRESFDERMGDLEQMKTQAIEAAKAGALDSANKISSKLLDDHKRQSEEAKKDSEKRVKETTEQLVNQITEVGKTIHSLNSEVESNRGTMDTVMRALSSPGGAGQHSELMLENTLTNFGLVNGRDFVLQKQVDNTKLRPDAMVFLPGNTVLVIDSKASKALLEIAEAESEEEEAAAYKNLNRTINTQLKSLASKNYKAEVISSYRESGREGESPNVINVMFLPTEGAVEKAMIADPKFKQKAAKLDILVAGSSALDCLIGMSRLHIGLQRQTENQIKIVEGTQKIVENLGIVFERTENVGKGIKTAAKNYMDLTTTLNKRLLPSIQRLASYGVQSNRAKQIPDHVPTYSFTEHERGDLIEGEASEVGTPPSLADLSDED